MTDRETMLSTMYQDDEAVIGTEQLPQKSLSSRTRKIRVGIIEYEVPTVEYVQQLEQMIARQSRMIEQQQRMIDRIAVALSKSQHSHTSHGREMEDVRRELSRKISQRDAF